MFVKSIENEIQRNNLDLYHHLGELIMCQHDSIDCNKGITVNRIPIMGILYVDVAARWMGTICFPLYFPINKNLF